MKYLLALLFCFTLAAQQTVNTFAVKTNLSVANVPVTLSVSNIAALASVNPAYDTQVDVQGYLTAGDGGGGSFQRISSTGITNLAAITVVSTVNTNYAWTRIWDKTDLKVAWFGAFPDDGVNDAPAIQSALNYAWAARKYNVNFDAGLYDIATTLMLPYRVNILGAKGWRYGAGLSSNPTSIEFLGGTRTSLKLMPNSNVPMLELASTDGPAVQSGETLEDGEVVNSLTQDSRIENIEFWGNGAFQTKYNCHGIVGNSKWYTTINNCSFVQIKGYAMWLFDLNVLKISNIYIVGHGRFFPSKGMFIYSTSDTIINNVEAGNCTGPSVWYNGDSSWVTVFSNSLLYNNFRTNSSYTISSWTTNTLANFSSEVFLESGDPVELRTTGVLPTGFNDTTLYFAVKISTNQFGFHSNKALALAGQYLTGSVTNSGTSTVIVGDPTSVYMSGGARYNTFTGIRADQNSGPGLVFRNAYGNHFYGVELFANNGTNPKPDPANGIVSEIVPDLEKSGVIFDKNAYNNNVFATIADQPIGYLVRSNAYNNFVNATYSNVSTNIVNLSTGNNYIDVEQTLSGDLSITNANILSTATIGTSASIGNTNLTTVLNLYGNSGGNRALKLYRNSGGLNQTVGLGVGSGGFSFFNESINNQIGVFSTDASNAYLFIGPQSSATPLTSLIYAGAGSGSNINGGELRIMCDLSTGTGDLTDAFSVLTGDVLSSGTTLQTATKKFVIEGDGDGRITGNFSVLTAGKGLLIKEGTNAKMGTAALTAGSATVSTTAVASNSRIYLTSNADGGTPGWLRVSARTAGTSFTITSSSATDTSTVAWIIVDPAP